MACQSLLCLSPAVAAAPRGSGCPSEVSHPPSGSLPGTCCSPWLSASCCHSGNSTDLFLPQQLPSCPHGPVQQIPISPTRKAVGGRKRGVSSGPPLYYWGAALGGRNLGLLGPQQGPHLADLPLDAGSCRAPQGTILFHAVTVVPHVIHVT